MYLTDSGSQQQRKRRMMKILKKKVSRRFDGNVNYKPLNLEMQLVGYTIKTWPTTSSAARSALDALASTHFVQPFPAYTSDGRLMPPEEYSTLRNALCEVQFTLSHWNMENLKKDVYAANVIAVNVIQAGKPVFAAPKRKKLALPKASQPSPAKRQRTDGGKKN